MKNFSDMSEQEFKDYLEQRNKKSGRKIDIEDVALTKTEVKELIAYFSLFVVPLAIFWAIGFIKDLLCLF